MGLRFPAAAKQRKARFSGVWRTSEGLTWKTRLGAGVASRLSQRLARKWAGPRGGGDSLGRGSL